MTLASRPDSLKSNSIAFGGEDQRSAMASKSDKQVTVEVKNNNNGRNRSRSRARSQSRGRGKSVKITVNSRGGSRRQNGRNKYQSNQRVRNIVTKQLRKQGVTGPKPAICQRATATLGTIGSNTSGTTEIEACILLNPVLLRMLLEALNLGQCRR